MSERGDTEMAQISRKRVSGDRESSSNEQKRVKVEIEKLAEVRESGNGQQQISKTLDNNKKTVQRLK